MRRNDAERAGVEHARDIFGVLAGTRTIGAMPMSGRRGRSARWHPSSAANARGRYRSCRSRRSWPSARSRRAGQPDRHRGHHLVARQLLLHGLRRMSADRHLWALPINARPIGLASYRPQRVCSETETPSQPRLRSVMNYDTSFKSVKDQVSPEEWQARVELAACYRLVDQYGMTDLIYNHITARIPGTEHLLINLYGLLYKEITASSLVKIDAEGEIVCQAHHRLRHQQIRLRDPWRDPQGAARRQMRAAHPHPGRCRGFGDELRAAAVVADLDPLPQPHRLSRLRGAGGRSRRARADRAGPRRAQRAGDEEPRLADLRAVGAGGVQPDVCSSNPAARRSTRWRRAPS